MFIITIKCLATQDCHNPCILIALQLFYKRYTNEIYIIMQKFEFEKGSRDHIKSKQISNSVCSLNQFGILSYVPIIHQSVNVNLVKRM